MPNRGRATTWTIAVVVMAALSGCNADKAGPDASSPSASVVRVADPPVQDAVLPLRRRAGAMPTAPSIGEQVERDAALRLVNELIARGDAESLVDAVLLLQLACGPTGCEGQDAARQQWLATAARQAPDHPLVALLEIQGCRTGCAQTYARFASLDPDNALAHVAALGEAASVDSMAVDRALRSGADAKVFDSYYPELIAAQAAALRRLPPPSEASRVAFGRNLDLQAIPDVADMRLMQAMATVAGVAMPSLQMLMQTCSAGSLRNADARRATCIAVLNHLANADTALVRMAGLSRLVELTANSSAQDHWREKLREFAWVQSQYFALQATVGPADLRVQAEQGEWLAMQALLRRHGVPVLPPPGWLPAQGHQSDLLSGGG